MFWIINPSPIFHLSQSLYHHKHPVQPRSYHSMLYFRPHSPLHPPEIINAIELHMPKNVSSYMAYWIPEPPELPEKLTKTSRRTETDFMFLNEPIDDLISSVLVGLACLFFYLIWFFNQFHLKWFAAQKFVRRSECEPVTGTPVLRLWSRLIQNQNM